MSEDEAAPYLSVLTQWELRGGKSIRRRLRFKDFVEAMAFINEVAELAEEEGHHPDIFVSYNRVRIDLTTHAIGGLSENDFILAAKIEGLARRSH
jgi:4a-hydroxytetrahydrobiopterin dehydratase